MCVYTRDEPLIIALNSECVREMKFASVEHVLPSAFITSVKRTLTHPRSARDAEQTEID